MKKWIQWSELFNELYIYNEDITVVPDSIKVSHNLSPLTNLSLNYLLSGIEHRNLILAFPSPCFHPLAIFSYIYAEKTRKTIINFTDKSNMREHINKYYLLENKEKKGYVSYYIPIGEIFDKEIKIEPYFPRISGERCRQIRKDFSKRIKQNLEFKNAPRVLVISKLNEKMKFQIESMVIDGVQLKGVNVPLDIGAIFFEFSDRFLTSQQATDSFINWLKPLIKKDIRVIIHLSNPDSPFIDVLKKSFDAFVLQFPYSLLKENSSILSTSKNYFLEMEKKSNVSRIKELNKLNVDTDSLYLKERNVEVTFPLNAGNLNYLLKEINELCMHINEMDLNKIIEVYYHTVAGLSLKLLSLVINPKYYKHKFLDPVYGWKFYSIPTILQISRGIFSHENAPNKDYLLRLVSAILSIYYEISECKDYGDVDGFSRVAKNYKFEELLNKEFQDSASNIDIIFVTHSPFERNILREKYSDKIKESNVDIIYIGDLYSRDLSISNTKLLIPGQLSLEHLHIISQPYAEIRFLVYQGEDELKIRKQIDLISAINPSEEKHSLESLKETLDFFYIGQNAAPIFEDFEKRSSSLLGDTSLEKEFKKESLFENLISKMVAENNEFAILKEQYRYEKKSITNLDSFLENDFGPNTMLKVRNMSTSIISEIRLPLTKTYLYFKQLNNPEPKEMSPKFFTTGDYFILFRHSERKTFLEIIADFFEEETIDISQIECWREDLLSFIEFEGLSNSEFYEQYRSICKNVSKNPKCKAAVDSWIKGEHSPQQSEDFLIIGKTIKSEEIEHNYMQIYLNIEKIRGKHRKYGRMIKPIVTTILDGTIEATELSYEEQIIYDLIKDSIYEIIEIM